MRRLIILHRDRDGNGEDGALQPFDDEAPIATAPVRSILSPLALAGMVVVSPSGT